MSPLRPLSPRGAGGSPPYGVTVPGNRWDLLPPPSADDAARTVTVVVTHYEQSAQLARTLAALARQTRPPDQVVVADDGSATRPQVPPGVEVVTQPDRGFRAAAARNLGASHARGDVLVFLDADTTPEPELLARLTALPARAPELLAVGRRRHADLSGHPTEGPGARPIELLGPEHELAEPAWLREAHARSEHLLLADESSYRFVISAVLACSRWWLHELGGFDETFEAYGGEDWDLAHRSWVQGGLVAHVPDAVAWHDGPDAGASTRTHPGGGTDPATAETAAVAARVAAPGAAYRGLLVGPADVVATCPPGWGRRELTVTLDGLLAAAPRTAVLLGAEQAGWFAEDPRVSIGSTPPGSARLHLDLMTPVLGGPHAWAEVLAGLDAEQTGAATLEVACAGTEGGPGSPVGRVAAELHDLRLHRRSGRWERPDLLSRATRDSGLRPADDVSLQAWLGGWA